MKNITEKAQSIFENLIVLALITIIAVGVYKLLNKWTHKEAPKPAKAHAKIMDTPSKELCSFMMKQCHSRFPEEY